MVFLLIFMLVTLTILTKAHIKALEEPENNPILFLNCEVNPSEKSVSKSMFLGEMDLLNSNPQIKRRLQQKTTVPKPEMPLFQIIVEQVAHTYYLYEVRLKVTLVPRSYDNAAKEAVKNKIVYFFIDGIHVGKAQVASSSVYFDISTKDTLKFRFKPGEHRIMALVAHDGKIFMGYGTLNVDIGRVKIQETTAMPSKIYYGYEGNKKYRTGHQLGDTITVSAKFIDINHPDVPIVGAKVFFRTHAVVLCEAITDLNGEAFFPLELTWHSMLRTGNEPAFSGPGDPPTMVQHNYNFFIEANELYQETTDWGRIYRSICACPYGYTYVKSTEKCIK